MPAVRELPQRSAKRAALAVLFAAVLACSNAVSLASTPPTAMLTYIVGLGTSKQQVVVAKLDGSSPRTLGPATSALLSPDGSMVAAIYTTSSSTLSVYPSAGGSDRVLARNQPFMQLLAWSPDSKLLLVAVGTAPRGQLMVFNAATRKTTTIATGVFKGASFAPGQSDDVVYALASDSNGSDFNLFVTMPNGTATRQLTHDNHSQFPVWGHSGIVFSRLTPAAKGSPTLQLWFIKPNGSGLAELTNMTVPAKSTGLTPIAFSADGKHLLANLVGPNLNWHEAYLLDLGNSKSAPRDLTGQNNGTTTGDAISTNGKLILATKGSSSNLASLSIDEFKWSGGKPTVIAKNGAYASWNR
jgi:hypothetical protein